MKNERIEKSHDSELCPVRIIVDRLSDKWAILILLQLAEHSKLRFNELSHQITDISQKMLTQTLRALEGDGLIARKYFAEIPPRVEYNLTELGATLIPHLMALTEWANAHMETILDNRKSFHQTS